MKRAQKWKVLVSESAEMHMKISLIGFSLFQNADWWFGFSPVCRTTEVSRKKKQVEKKQTGSKILVRNIPFQATIRELRELFW